MLDRQHRCVVVGAGVAGGRAVETLGARGFKGHICLIGAEHWPPYDRPPLSKRFLLDGAEPESLFLQQRPAETDSVIETIRGVSATAIDRAKRRVQLANGQAVPYDRLLLATGARPRRLPLPGADLPGIRYLRTIEDAVSIRSCLTAGQAMVVIGGGYIGLELAAVARRRGVDATVLEAKETVLSRVLPPLLGRIFERLHRDHGVTLLTRVGIAGFEGERQLSTVRLSDGRRIAADLAVIGVGAEPNAELAAEAGLAVDDGILTDEFGRTTDPRIFAAGDVTRHWNPLLGRRLRLESWQSAQNQAVAAAGAICGDRSPYAEIPWFWSDQYDVNLQIVGLPAAHDDIVLRQAGEYRLSAFFLAGGRLVAAAALDQPRDIAAARRLIQHGQPVDRGRLVDASVPLRELLKSSVPP